MSVVNAIRRITVELPGDLLDAALEVSGKGVTETLVEALELIRRRRFYSRALALQGKLRLDLDLEEARGRRRHGASAERLFH